MQFRGHNFCCCLNARVRSTESVRECFIRDSIRTVTCRNRGRVSSGYHHLLSLFVNLSSSVFRLIAEVFFLLSLIFSVSWEQRNLIKSCISQSVEATYRRLTGAEKKIVFLSQRNVHSRSNRSIPIVKLLN